MWYVRIKNEGYQDECYSKGNYEHSSSTGSPTEWKNASCNYPQNLHPATSLKEILIPRIPNAIAKVQEITNRVHLDK